MKTIRAYSCIREGSSRSGGAVCFLLNETHAVHTLRTFLRGQGEHAVLEPISDLEAQRLLGADAEEEAPAAEKPAA